MNYTIDNCPVKPKEILIYSGKPGDGGYAGRRVIVDDVWYSTGVMRLRIENKVSVGRPNPVWSRKPPFRLSLAYFVDGTLRKLDTAEPKVDPITIERARPIVYERSTDLIRLTGPWHAGWVLTQVRQMVTDQPYELREVTGWGYATHRLSFNGETEAAGHNADGDFVGCDFLVRILVRESCTYCGMVANIDPSFHEERYGHTPAVRRDGKVLEFDYSTYTFSKPIDG